MKNLIYICLFAITSLGMKIPDSGVCVVEFNASFNAANSVDWIDNLSDCKGRRVDIATEPDLQKEHKIVVVPTVIVFNEGEEVKRFQANILRQLKMKCRRWWTKL